jgi:hypothetical protein
LPSARVLNLTITIAKPHSLAIIAPTLLRAPRGGRRRDDSDEFPPAIALAGPVIEKLRSAAGFDQDNDGS